MARYADISELAEREAWSELAEAAAPDAKSVTGDLLKHYIVDDDIADIDADDLVALTAAEARLNRDLDDASADVDSYIYKRYGALGEQPKSIKVKTLDIVVYRLLGGDTSSRRYILYRRALKWLSDIASGKLDLEIDTDDDAANGVRVSRGGKRIYTETSLGEYR